MSHMLYNSADKINANNEISVLIVMLFVNFFEAIIVASIFFNLSNDTSSFFKRGTVLFMTVLLNAFSSMLEILALYAKRTIVEKHNRYALYHPSAEAVASMIMDLPYKITNAIIVNSTLYFMAGLRLEAGAFFFFFLTSFTMMMAMSMFFRFFASITKSIEQALAPSSIILLALVLYTGFVIPVRYMRGWASWMRWINPVYYGFESVVVNEFHGREFPCVTYIPSGPSYDSVAPDQRACAVQGSVPGSSVVNGTNYAKIAYQYDNSHKWRNFGIILALTVFLLALHLIMSELVAAARSKGEVLVFRRSKMQNDRAKRHQTDEETGSQPVISNEKHNDSGDSNLAVEKQSSVFHWEDVCYDIQIKGETRTILDHVDGWIKPGTLTALMVSSSLILVLDIVPKRGSG